MRGLHWPTYLDIYCQVSTQSLKVTRVRCFCQGIRDFVFRDSAESQVACRRKLKWLNLLDVMTKVIGIVIILNITRIIIINHQLRRTRMFCLYLSPSRDSFSLCSPSSSTVSSSSRPFPTISSYPVVAESEAEDFHFSTLPVRHIASDPIVITLVPLFPQH